MTQATWTTGQVIGGRFRLTEPLGSGGQGSVWRVDHLVLKCPVALKLLDPGIAHHPEAVARFLREAQAAATLRSPHVVQILDHGVHEGIPYIAMELLEGEPLSVRLAREGRLSPAATTRMIAQVCRAVAKAHDVGIVHRDLKPANIFLVRNDDDEIAKVLDFGIAKVMSAVELTASASQNTRTGAMLGTPFYMSPEQARGKTVDLRSDLWSIAVIVYECICGRVPFEGDSVGDLVLSICAQPLPKPSAVAPVVAGFDAWWEKAVSRDPAGRFQSAREMADALRALIQPGIPEPAASRPSLVDVPEAPGLHQMQTLAAAAPVASAAVHSTTAAPVASVSTDGVRPGAAPASEAPSSASRSRLFAGAAVGATALVVLALLISRSPADGASSPASEHVIRADPSHAPGGPASPPPRDPVPAVATAIPEPAAPVPPEATAPSAAPKATSSASRGAPRRTQPTSSPRPAEPKRPPKEDLGL